MHNDPGTCLKLAEALSERGATACMAITASPELKCDAYDVAFGTASSRVSATAAWSRFVVKCKPQQASFSGEWWVRPELVTRSAVRGGPGRAGPSQKGPGLRSRRPG